jgi:hypothetical protein
VPVKDARGAVEVEAVEENVDVRNVDVGGLELPTPRLIIDDLKTDAEVVA